jgi:endonuclease III-like uncharacterized protein
MKDDYETLRKHFENSLPRDIGIYKEFHALIVEWESETSEKPAK